LGSRSAKVVTTNTAGTDWHIQFKYINFSLKKDSTYTVRFSAKSSQNRQIYPSIMRNDAPYTWYGGGVCNLTNEWQNYQFTVTPNENIDGFGRVSFSLGAQLGTVWFDDISLGEPQVKAFLLRGSFFQQFPLWDFRLRRSCKISVTQNSNDQFPMRCNRKTGSLAVTPLSKINCIR
jgi:hypothetical protein